MVVIYDRFVFFSVEKFFIPLLYSCLNILVQRSCASVCVCVRMLYVCGTWTTVVPVHLRARARACVCVLCTFLRVCVCVCVACERGGAPRERSATEKDRTEWSAERGGETILIPSSRDRRNTRARARVPRRDYLTRMLEERLKSRERERERNFWMLPLVWKEHVIPPLA